MTTPINELSELDINNNFIPEDSEIIDEDECNSEIVNEILSELNDQNKEINYDNQLNNSNNSNNNNSNNYMTENANNIQYNRPLDNNINIPINNPEIIEINNQNFSTTANESIKEKLIKKIKEPLIVILIAFLINSPLISSILVKNLPKLFSSGVSPSIQWLSIILKSIIIGVLFFSIKTLI